MSLVFEQTLIKPYCLLEIFIHWESQVIFLQVPSNSNTEILKRKKKPSKQERGIICSLKSSVVLCSLGLPLFLPPLPSLTLSAFFFNLCLPLLLFLFPFLKACVAHPQTSDETRHQFSDPRHVQRTSQGQTGCGWEPRRIYRYDVHLQRYVIYSE